MFYIYFFSIYWNIFYIYFYIKLFKIIWIYFIQWIIFRLIFPSIKMISMFSFSSNNEIIYVFNTMIYSNYRNYVSNQ